jgi:cell wall-associated NlpC family hydrolase
MNKQAIPLSAFCGIPYRWGGDTRFGADCWGLVVLVYRLLRHTELRPVSDLNGRDLQAVANRFEQEKKLYLGEALFVPQTEPDWLDIVEMSPEHPHLPFHVGVFAEGCVLHARVGVGSILTPLAELAPRIKGFYRHATH